VSDVVQVLSAVERELHDAIAVAGGPSERLQEIMERPSPLAEVPGFDRVAENVVRGCATTVWVTGSVEGGVVRLAASASTPLVAGIVRLVCEAYDGAAVAEARERPFLLLAALGLDRRLTPTRLRAVALVRARIAELAS
jgi:cysteine desulfuration protein SufE